MRTILCIIILAVALSACCSMESIGQLGRYDVYDVSAVGFIAPSVRAFVAVDPETGGLVPLGSGGSEGLGVSAIKATSVLGGAGIIGESLESTQELELKQ